MRNATKEHFAFFPLLKSHHSGGGRGEPKKGDHRETFWGSPIEEKAENNCKKWGTAVFGRELFWRPLFSSAKTAPITAKKARDEPAVGPHFFNCRLLSEHLFGRGLKGGATPFPHPKKSKRNGRRFALAPILFFSLFFSFFFFFGQFF